MARSARAGLVSMNLLFKEKRDRFAFAHVYRHELFNVNFGSSGCAVIPVLELLGKEAL